MRPATPGTASEIACDFIVEDAREYIRFHLSHGRHIDAVIYAGLPDGLPMLRLQSSDLKSMTIRPLGANFIEVGP